MYLNESAIFDINLYKFVFVVNKFNKSNSPSFPENKIAFA
jgi:hypothetical protein